MTKTKQRIGTRLWNLMTRLRELPNVVATAATRIEAIDQQIGSLQQLIDQSNFRTHAVEQQVGDIRQLIEENTSRLESISVGIGQCSAASGHLANSVNAAENHLAGRFSLMASQMEALAGLVGTLSEALSGFEQRSSSRIGDVSNALNALHNAILLGNNELITRNDRFNTALATNIAESAADFAGRQGAVANEINGILNAVLPNSQAIDSIGQRLDGLVRSYEMDASLNMLAARGMAALIGRARRNPSAEPKSILPPNEAATLAEQMTAMREIAPNNFASWEAAYNAGVAEGLRSSEGNLSHEGHVGAGYFRMFINVHARGRILDVGCGPIAVPSYLSDWPTDALAGIDPQLPFEEHPFLFAQSFAEWIPWPDASFETVVIGTSLDHIYLLDRALAEIRRVLVPTGRLLIWTALFDETPPYQPKGPEFIPPDSYHLFHPGRNWFFELFQSDYRLIERMPIVANAELLAYELKGPQRGGA